MTDVTDVTARVLTLRQDGMGVNRIAAMLGIGSGRVARILNEAGLRKMKRAPDQALRDRIVEMRKANVSVRDIAAETTWSEAFVQRVLQDAGLNGWDANRAVKSQAQAPQQQLIVAEYGAGKSASAIARELGVRKTYVTDIAKAAGIYREQDRMSDEQRRDVLALRSQGMAVAAIAKKIGRSPAAVREWLVKNGMGERMRRPIRIEGDVAYVTLTQGKVAVIDAADVYLIESRSWSAQRVERKGIAEWYATTGGSKKCQQMHRVIMGNPPELIDHRDHDGLNNRRSNLRLTNHSGNMRNARRSKVTGLPRGVRKTKSGKFFKPIIAPYKLCDTPEEAVADGREVYFRLFGQEMLDTEKFMPDVIDPETGEILDS